MSNKRGQTVLEYGMLIGIVTIALIYMSTDLKRGVQNVVKITADQMGAQVNSDQDFTQKVQHGILNHSSSNTWQSHQQSINDIGQIMNHQVGDFSETETNSTTKIGN